MTVYKQPKIRENAIERIAYIQGNRPHDIVDQTDEEMALKVEYIVKHAIRTGF